MANKTIHELSPASTVSGSYEFAVYDTDGSTTKKATADQIFTASDLLYADETEGESEEVDFDSQDALNPSSTTPVTLLQGTDSWSQRFVKISQMFKNIRYLINKIGTTDISSIGNGTATGAISTLNDNKINGVQIASASAVSHTVNVNSGSAHLIGLASSNGNARALFYVQRLASGNVTYDEILAGNNIAVSVGATTITFTYIDNTSRTLLITDILLRGTLINQ